MASKRIRIFHRLVEKAKSIDLNEFIKNNGTRLVAVFAASEKLIEFKDDFKLVWILLKAYAKREYTEIPIKSISAIVGALLYILMPLDALPDFILGFGLIDDAAVFGYALKLISDDIRKFAAWQEAKAIEGEIETNQIVKSAGDFGSAQPPVNNPES
ncbi:MAG: DUF1232 domain-containing protein [Salibacteraceae bacterium]|nr:DUF1232 domain-containing protein [Salibacteraceae bacterium]MDP4934307.1 DUF1232 domain-containing protein [Salibacteraceae bacterium]